MRVLFFSSQAYDHDSFNAAPQCRAWNCTFNPPG